MKRKTLAILIAAFMVFTGGLFTSYADSISCDHDWQTVAEKEATDTTAGNMEYEYCSKCHMCRVSDDEVATVDHYIYPAYNSAGKYDADEIKSVELQHGDSGIYEQIEEADYNQYCFYWHMFEDGDILKLDLKNGKTATYVFAYNYNSGDYSHFTNVDDPDDMIAYGNGFDGLFDEQTIEPGETKEFTIKYKGSPFTVSIHVKQNPIKALTYKGSGDGVIRIEENDEECGYWDEDENGDPYFFYWDISFNNGDILTVTYADGSEKDFVYNANNDVFISDDADVLNHIDWQSDQYFNHWYAGNTYYISVGYNMTYTDDVVPVEIVPAYPTGEYKIWPKSVDPELRTEESVEIVPEVRTASADPSREYDVVNANIEYAWIYDSNDFEITKDTSGSTPKYIVMRKTDNAASITLVATWDDKNVTRTYDFKCLYCNHDLVLKEAVPATCTEDGLIERYVCRSCGETFIMTSDGDYMSISPDDAIVPAAGHKWDSKYTVDKKATTTAPGSKSIHCTVCGAIKPGTSVSIHMVNPLKVTPKTAAVKYSALKKKAQTLTRSKVLTVKNAKGTVTYKLVSVTKSKFKKYFKVSSSTGKVTIKKGLKKGTYKVKVKVTAAGNDSYSKLTKTVTFTVKVR